MASIGTLAITTTTGLTLPTSYQAALSTAAASIAFIGSVADVNTALATLKWTGPATATTGTVKVYAAYVGINGTLRWDLANNRYLAPDAATTP